jgi:hypothetical protein
VEEKAAERCAQVDRTNGQRKPLPRFWFRLVGQTSRRLRRVRICVAQLGEQITPPRHDHSRNGFALPDEEHEPYLGELFCGFDFSADQRCRLTLPRKAFKQLTL